MSEEVFAIPDALHPGINGYGGVLGRAGGRLGELQRAGEEAVLAQFFDDLSVGLFVQQPFGGVADDVVNADVHYVGHGAGSLGRSDFLRDVVLVHSDDLDFNARIGGHELLGQTFLDGHALFLCLRGPELDYNRACGLGCSRWLLRLRSWLCRWCRAGSEQHRRYHHDS